MKKLLLLAGAITIFICGSSFSAVAIEDNSEYPDSGFHPTV